MNIDIKNKIETKEFKDLFIEFSDKHEMISYWLGIKDDYLIALGRVVKSFETITWNLQAFLIKINHGQYDHILISQISFKNLVGILVLLCQQKSFLPEKIKKLGTLLNNGEEIRNRLMHSAWLQNMGDQNFLHRLKWNKKTLRPEQESFSLDEFNQITEWFDKLNTILEGLIEEYKKEDTFIQPTTETP